MGLCCLSPSRVRVCSLISGVMDLYIPPAKPLLCSRVCRSGGSPCCEKGLDFLGAVSWAAPAVLRLRVAIDAATQELYGEAAVDAPFGYLSRAAYHMSSVIRDAIADGDSLRRSCPAVHGDQWSLALYDLKREHLIAQLAVIDCMQREIAPLCKWEQPLMAIGSPDVVA